MTDAIAHRGPDGDGHWISDDGKCGLGHRRLSIIDLSEAGSQPMHYLDRYVLVFNGEIYNYVELKAILQKKDYRFSSNTDSEVLLALYHEKQEAMLADIDGMFAFVIYDRQEKKLFAARDRFGEKPFFFSYKQGNHFLFGSEMKALWSSGVSKEVDNVMLYNFLANNFVENPENISQTFYTECIRLAPAHYLILDTATCEILAFKRYWDIDINAVENNLTVEKATQTFRDLFSTSITRRLRSDVPVGSSLSGGLDSSLVVCQIADMLQKTGGAVQKTFSARFKDHSKDEGPFMQKVIDQTKVEGHFTYPSEEGFIQELDKLMYHQEEPFVSSSMYAQYKVMQLAKENNVTVLLDGQGADEILAGYHSYYVIFFTELKKRFPALYKREFTAYQQLHQSNTINGVLKKDFKFFLKSTLPNTVEPIKKLHHRYLQQVSPFFTNDFFQTYSKNDFVLKQKYVGLNDALYYSSLQHGLHSLLRYADRNSMAHSREVRLPFLSHELVSFCFSLPSTMKMHNGWTKWIMREAYKELLPQEIAWRKDKIGFDVPQNNWLQKPKVQDLILDSTQTLVNQKILHAKTLSRNGSAGSGHATRRNWQRLMAANLF
jgi:asparagine synthase (glutamine-hydrolysing)